MNTLFLQLGSNLGDREQLIKDAMNLINEKAGKVVSSSKIYESDFMKNARAMIYSIILYYIILNYNILY